MERTISEYVANLLEQRHLCPSHLARELGVSHPTVGRWVTGEDKPNPRCCIALARYTDTPILDIFKMAGHLPEDFSTTTEGELPDFWEYMRLKYPIVPRKFLGAIFPLIIDKELWGE